MQSALDVLSVVSNSGCCRANIVLGAVSHARLTQEVRQLCLASFKLTHLQYLRLLECPSEDSDLLLLRNHFGITSYSLRRLSLGFVLLKITVNKNSGIPSVFYVP